MIRPGAGAPRLLTHVGWLSASQGFWLGHWFWQFDPSLFSEAVNGQWPWYGLLGVGWGGR